VDDEEPTAEELAEAERLARALERGHAPNGAPEDALATAGLLRFARDGGALEPERGERILDDALARARPRPSRSRHRFTLFGLLGLAAAGAASIALVVRTQAPEGVATLPAPPRELLEAELAAASGPSDDLAVLDGETARYRGAVYANLKERYGK
jgi:hypothetical protein